MKMRTVLCGFVLFILVMSSCERNDISIGNNDTNEANDEITSTTMVEGIVRIKLQRNTTKSMSVSLKSGRVKTSVSNLDTIFSSIGVTSFKRTFPYSGKFEARSVAKGLDLWYDVKYDTTQVKLANVLKKLSDITEVATSEGIPVIQSTAFNVRHFNEVVSSIVTMNTTETTFPFDDEHLKVQWHYNNDGSLEDGLDGADIDLFDAWKIQKGNPEVIVSVVDGGIDFDHEDLKNNMWINPNETSNGLDDDNNGYIDDIYGYNFVSEVATIVAHEHGTHVAGTIGAQNNNKIGVCGIAGGDETNPGVRLMSCQVFQSDANGDDISAPSFAEAIKYGADNGAIISQNSWGYTNATSLPQSMKEAIDYFIEFAGVDENGNQVGPMKGGVVIFAAGNESSDFGLPASYEPVIAVSAIAPDYKASDYTNYGSWVDIAAPGGAYNDNGRYTDASYMIASTVPDDKYGWSMGTSMACPHVSGVAALIASEYGGEGFTADDLKKRLFQGTVNIDKYNPDFIGQLGIGLVNAAAALANYDDPAPLEVANVLVGVDQNKVSFTWDVTGNETASKAAYYRFYYSKTSFTSEDINNSSNIDNKLIYSPHTEIGQQLTFDIDYLDFNSTYYVAMAAENVLNVSSSLSDVVTIVTDPNAPPVITPSEYNSYSIKAFETMQLQFNIDDPNEQTVSWILNDPSGYAVSSGSDNLARIYVNGIETPAGTYKASITATDEMGASSKYDFTYTVQPNVAPSSIKAIENVYIASVKASYPINLADYFIDEDGEDLSYYLSYDESIMSASVSGNTLTMTPSSAGLTSFTVTASDALGAEASLSFKVMSRDGSNEIDLYPNPVVDKLNVRMGNSIDGTISVEIYNTNGVLRDTKTADISTFSPAQLDLSGLSTGSYTLKIQYETQTFERNIVKL